MDPISEQLIGLFCGHAIETPLLGWDGLFRFLGFCFTGHPCESLVGGCQEQDQFYGEEEKEGRREGGQEDLNQESVFGTNAKSQRRTRSR